MSKFFSLFEEDSTPSLRAIAMAIGVQPAKVYAASKKPVIGQVYDPNSVNQDAVSELIESKVGVEVTDFTGLPVVYNSIDEIADAVVRAEEHIQENDRRRTSQSRFIEVDGVQVERRKSTMFEHGSEHESLICLNGDQTVYKMVYQTRSFTVLRPIDGCGNYASDTLRLMSNATLNTKTVSPLMLKDAIEVRMLKNQLGELESTDEAEES